MLLQFTSQNFFLDTDLHTKIGVDWLHTVQAFISKAYVLSKLTN